MVIAESCKLIIWYITKVMVASAAPTSSTSGRIVGPIPTYGTSFLGRSDDLRRLSRLVEHGEQLVTVVGPSGIGKTRLAHRIALDYQNERSVLFCELAAVRTLDEVLSRLAIALDLPLQGASETDETTARVGRALSRLGPALVVMDNFEQLDDDVAAVLVRWLAQSPEAQIVVTSRRQLAVQGERCFHLFPLPLDEALDLFCERAHGAAEVADRETLEALVEHLDRLPLALELAAARTLVLSPRQLLERLEQRFEVLRDPRRPPNERHASLENAIGFSWDLLDGTEKSCLTEAAIFQDGFDAEAAEHVIEFGKETGPPVLDVLEQLVRSSFLNSYTRSTRLHQVRFSMYESIRAYAWARLEQEGVEPAVGARHGEYYLQKGEEWLDGVNGPQAARCRARLVVDQANLLAVYRRSWPSDPDAVARAALILSPVLSGFGPASTHAEVLDRGVDAARRGDAGTHCKLLATRGWASLHRGRSVEAERDLLSALDEARKGDAPLLESDVLAKLSHLHIRLGQLVKARAYVEAALNVCDDHDLTSIRGQVLERKGLLLFQEGSYEEAELTFDQALDLHRLNDDHLWQGFTHCDRGEVRMHRGRTALAIADFDKALDFQDEVGDQRLMGVVEFCLGQIRHEEEDLSRAREHYRKAIEALCRASHRRVEAEALEAWGSLELLAGDTAMAQSLFAESLEILRALHHQSGEMRLEASLALCQAWEGRLDSAMKTLESVQLATIEEHSSREIIELLSAAIEIEGAGKELAAAHENEAKRWLESARQRMATIELTTIYLRIVSRLCATRLDRYGFHSASEEVSPAAIIFGPECRWFSLDGGDPISLERRGAMRLVLKALVENRVSNPGAVLDAYELFDRGWPGQNVMPDVGAARVYESIRVLRKLGLAHLLLHRDGGYLIDADQEIDEA